MSNQSLNVNEILYCLQHGIDHLQSYPEAVRSFSFGLNYHSPRAYEYVREVFHKHLPHVSAIRKWYQQSDLDRTPGIGKKALQLLQQKADELKKTGDQLQCSLIFDEMSIRKHVQRCSSTKQYLGSITYGKNGDEDEGELPLANNAIVFMLSALNIQFKAPIAYHFITSINSDQRVELVSKLLFELSKLNIHVRNLTFDGYASNTVMCEKLGAKLFGDFPTPFFKSPYNGDNVYIIYDPSHMEKLVRNCLGDYKILYDGDNNKIEWKYFVLLEKISSGNNLGLTHKLNKRHIQYTDRKMHVRTAVETFSSSVADLMEYLMKSNNSDFKNASSTIKFIRVFNTLFDVLNTKRVNSKNPDMFKSAINASNERVIFDFFSTTKHYITSLKIENKSGELIPILNSKRKTGFHGFLTDILSVEHLYTELIREQHIMRYFATYRFSQDHIEMFFGKIRSLHGWNDNPTVEQFMSSYQKLQMNFNIMLSECSNVSNRSNIFGVSSRCSNVTGNENGLSELELNILTDLEQIEASNYLTDDTYDPGIAFVAAAIENKIFNCDQVYCDFCLRVLKENEKINSKMCINSSVPCKSTYYICKTVDTYLKTHQQIQNNFNEKVVNSVLRTINISTIYPEFFEMEHDIDHRHYIIKFCITEYIRIKSLYLCKFKTQSTQNRYIRNKLRKNAHFAGQ